MAKRAVHPELSKLGARVRWLREQKGWTQKELAEKADVSTKRLGEVERGAQNAEVLTTVRLAQALDVPVFSLFAPENLVPPSAHPALVKNYELAREAVNELGQSMGLLPRTPLEKTSAPAGDETVYARRKRLPAKRKKS